MRRLPVQSGVIRVWQVSHVLILCGMLVLSLTGGTVAGAPAHPASQSASAQPTPHAVEPVTEPQLADVAVSDLSGSGTAADPYRISNAAELQAMEDDLDASYVLVSEIDATATATANGGAGFDPIGNASAGFTGQFDGDGYTITGLTIERPATEDVGLFGETGEGAVIASVELSDSSVTGKDDVGALVGDLEERSVVRNISMSGSVTGENDTGGLVGVVEASSIVEESSAVGTVTGSDEIGGLVGSNVGGVVTESSSRAIVTATGEFVQPGPARGGGLVGGNFNGAVINQSYATGTVDAGKAGGITGENYNSSRVASTYATGSINGTERVTGGVVGENFRDCPFREQSSLCDNFGPSTVTDSYWDTQTTGQTTSAGGTGLTTAEMQGSAAEGNMTGLAFSTVWETVPGDYPELVALTGGDSGSTPGETDPSSSRLVLEPQSQTVETGGTATVEVVLTNADGGVGTYGELTVSVTDTDTASITEVSDLTGAGTDTQTIASDGSNATIVASFGGDTTDTGDVPIVSVAIAGATVGTTNLTLGTTDDVFRENGSVYEVAGTRNSSLTVTNATEQPEIVEGTPAADTDDDGLLDDFNGNGNIDRGDAQALFNALGTQVLQDNADLLDYNGNDAVDRGDVQAVFQAATA